MTTPTKSQLEFLQSIDTPTVCNLVEIVAPERLREVRPGLVIVMNPAYTEEIQRDLERLGVEATVEAL